jgi:hypothetical protein
MTKSIPIEDILGCHPKMGLGVILKASDTYTKTGVPHRVLAEADFQHDRIISCFREMLVRHHVSPEAIERDKKRQEAMKRLGFNGEQSRMKRFPTNPLTRRGNLAEVVLAEYLISTTTSKLPIYRLRYNPNVEQAIKGDDVLAFDLDSDPVRIIVGEAKFRKTSSKAVVIEMLEGLNRSHKGGIPISLQFVADRLFEMGDEDTGNRVLECATLFALEKLRLDYVGMLMSDLYGSERLNKHTADSAHRLAVISFALDSPDAIVDPCYNDLDGQL